MGDPATRLLLQHDFLQQFAAHGFADFLALFRQLLSLLFASHNLVAQGFGFRVEAVHGGVVLELNRNTNIPILGIGLGLLQENFVVDEDPPATACWPKTPTSPK